MLHENPSTLPDQVPHETGQPGLPQVQSDMASLLESADKRRADESPSEWYRQMQGELEAFEDSGYQDLGVLHIEEAAEDGSPASDRPEKSAENMAAERHIGEVATTADIQNPSRELEQARNLNGQLMLPEGAEVNEDLSSHETMVRTFRLGAAEVMVASPRSGELREDPNTKKPLDPMLLVLGINGDAKYPWATMALSQGGEELPQNEQAHAGRHVVAIRYPEKLEGKIKERVPLGEDVESTVPEFDMIQARNILTALQMLQAERVDVVTESRGAIVNTIAMELARQEGTLSTFGDVLNITPAGYGAESSLQYHAGAAKIAVHGLYRSLLLREKLDTLARRLKGSGNIPGGRFFRDPLGWRREQVSVGGAAENNLPEVAARIEHDPGRMQRQDTTTHTYDPLDPAIREKNLSAQNVGDIPMKRTRFFGHAIPYGRRSAIRWIDNHFQEVRGVRAQYTKAA